MSKETSLRDELKKHGHSVTRARKDVFIELQRSGPCTIAELNSKLSSGMHRASIYRTVQLFEEIGVVRRIQIGWKYKLELSDIFNDHHHHAHCVSCYKILSLPLNNQLERLIMIDAEKQGFEITEHNVELYGYCQQCQTKKTPDE